MSTPAAESTPDITAVEIIFDVLQTPPTKTITAARLWELTKEDATLDVLTGIFDIEQGYRVNAQGGPYLMTIEQATKYKAKCDRVLNPTAP